MFLNWVKPLVAGDELNQEQSDRVRTNGLTETPPTDSDESLPVMTTDLAAPVDSNSIKLIHNGKRALITGITGQVRQIEKH